MSVGGIPPEIRVHGSFGQGRCILVREGKDDVDLSDLLAIFSVTAEVKVGEMPVVSLKVAGRLVHVP